MYTSVVDRCHRIISQGSSIEVSACLTVLSGRSKSTPSSKHKTCYLLVKKLGPNICVHDSTRNEVGAPAPVALLPHSYAIAFYFMLDMLQVKDTMW